MKKIILFVILIISLIVFYVFIIESENNVKKTIQVNNFDKSEQEYNEEVDYKKEIKKIKVEYNNDDVVGVLSIPKANYSVPLLQTTDNEYYLNHAPDKTQNKNGSIFLDYRVDLNTSKKQLIYGHNSDKKQMPFYILENYYDKEFYKNHKYIEIISSKKVKKYEIFSVYVEPEDFTYMKLEFASDEEYLEHIKQLHQKSMYKIDASLKKDDEILILQTCSTHKDYKKYNKKYLLIVSRRIL